jgi:hypothetical protein
MKGILLVAVLCAATARGSGPLRFSSGPARVSLIELYTSEGCSSCPPADQWLGALRDSPGLWRVFVPVEFHVNYWDNLGWKDRLSSRAFTGREYAYASAWGSGSVYTPCFVRNGTEWKPSWGTPGADGRASGSLEVEIEAGGTCAVRFVPAVTGSAAGYRVHVALLGGGLASKVTAGENSGETLRHEFVVLGLVEAELSPAAPGAALGASVALPEPSVPDSRRRALAAWVTRPGELEPLQATGGWLP